MTLRRNFVQRIRSSRIANKTCKYLFISTWLAQWCFINTVYRNRNQRFKQLPSSGFSVSGPSAAPLRTRNAPGWCCGSRLGSWCRTEGLWEEWWEKGARPAEADPSAAEEGDRTPRVQRVGPPGEGSRGGSLAVGSVRGPCEQPMAVVDTH